MTRPANSPRVPGRTLLKIARLLFSERFVSAVVHPTIADLQSEVAAAGASRVRRLRAQWRGCCAFWRVTLVAPFAAWAAPTGNETAVSSVRVLGHLAVGSLVFAFMTLTRAMLGISVAVLAVAGVLIAILIHAWYERHPSDTPAPAEPAWRSPQINFSSTEVNGNMGGLIFVIGSVLVVSLGLPSVLWFLIAATVAGCLLAWRLAAWHTRHPNWGLPENRIVLR
ncbi:MAG TPA: hypothetical protein VKE51_01510 [Vicinamibacterales bacterium]|nr:hypothetical protein [Vicinamibacterales bacterium]